jgi:Zinc knuckle
MTDEATITSSSSTIQTVATGRGHSRGGSHPGRGGQRGHGRNSRNQSRGARNNIVRSTFKGNTPDMNGHVFECYEERGDRTQFPKTLEALGEYAAKNLKHPEDLKSLFEEEMVAPNITEPADLPATPTKRQEVIWEAGLKSYSRRLEEMRSNLTTLYAVIWGQCSEAMRTKIRALADFPTGNRNNNCVWLLHEIKGVTHQFDTKRSIFLSLLDARIAYYTCSQAHNQSDAEYLAIFRSNIEVLEYYKATIGESYLLIDDAAGTLTIQQRTAISRSRTIAMAFLRGSDPRRYVSLMSDLANQKTRGNDHYPVDLTAAYSMLVNYHVPISTRGQQSNGPPITITAGGTNSNNANDQVGPHTFAQAARSTSSPSATSSVARMGTDGVLHEGITCFQCSSSGHYANQCPGAVSLVQFACVLTQTANEDTDRYKGIPSSWILLDSQSNISVFNNQQMVTDIRLSPQEVCVRTNGGEQTSTHIADFKNLGVVWYNEQSIANILSFSEVRKKCRVTMDTSLEPAMFIHRADGSTMKFTEHSDGLFYYDTCLPSANVSLKKFTFVETVSQNKSVFVAREIEAADRARELYRKLGRPSQKQFEDVIKKT